MSKSNGFNCRAFFNFANALPQPIDLSQFSRIDYDRISWTKRPRYEGAPMYITITLSETRPDGNIFRLTINNSDYSFNEYLYGETPQVCLNKLYREMEKQIKKKTFADEVWKRYGF